MFSHMRAKHLLISLFIILCSYGTGLQAEIEFAKPRVAPARVNPIESYLLPANDPLQDILRVLFEDTHMFRSGEHFKQAGFRVVRGHNHLMVGFHPSIPSYVIKKFPDMQSQTFQVSNFIKRINGSRAVRESIIKNNCKHLIVPQKWLYKLPSAFSSKNGTRSYVLISENMDLCGKEENLDLYYHMDREVLTELCTVLHDLGGCDAFPRNQTFTRSGQIAFVDTEHVGGMKGHFLKHVVPTLNKELQAYAVALWEKLEDDQKARERRR